MIRMINLKKEKENVITLDKLKYMIHTLCDSASKSTVFVYYYLILHQPSQYL